jgi:hypothetical protein
MTTTERILTTFTSKVDMEKEYTRSELGKMLTEVYKEIREGTKGEKKTRKKAKKEEGGEEKKKREPTLYNLFVKDTMGVVKEENPEMSRQDLMREVGRMWKEKKGEVVEVNEEVVEVNEEVEEVNEEVEKVNEEVEKVKKVKKGKKGKKE